MTTTRPAIPEAVKAEVRQRCGFGCIFCGLPIFEYDHLVPYAQDRRHLSANINLLCPLHHSLKSKGQLSEQAVARQALVPVNTSRDRTTGFPLQLTSSKIVFELGDSFYRHDFDVGSDLFRAIQIREKLVMGARRESGWLLLDLALSDLQDNDLIRVDRGEVTFTTSLTDLQIVGRRVSVRHKSQDVIDIEIVGDGHIRIRRGIFASGGLTLVVDGESAELRGYYRQDGKWTSNYRVLGYLGGNIVTACESGIGLKFDAR